MTPTVVCRDCDIVMEPGDWPEVYETCDACEQYRYEVERDEAMYEFEQEWP